MKDYSILKTLDEVFKDIKVDKKLGEKLRIYRLSWITSSKDNVEFSSTHLLGTVKPIFSSADERGLFEEVLGLSYDDTKKIIHNLKTIPKDRLVSRDVYNILTMYLIHRFLLLKLDKYALEAYLLFGYKVLVRRYNYFFNKFNIKKEIAVLAYENMSRHYIIKITGSVHKMLEYRAQDYISKKGVNYKRIYGFESEDVLRAIVDGYGRLNSMLKSVMSITMDVLESGNRLQSQSATIATDQGNVIRTITDGLDSQIQHLLLQVNDRNSFINKELMGLATVSTSLSVDALDEVLVWISKNYNSSKWHDKIRDSIVTSLSVTHNYLLGKTDNGITVANLPEVLKLTRSMWGSSRENDKEYDRVKKLGREIVKKATNRRDPAMISMITTAMFLYFLVKVLMAKKV